MKLVVFHMMSRQGTGSTHCTQRDVASGSKRPLSAEEAAHAGVDAVVARGRQAGGHNKSVVRTIAISCGHIIRRQAADGARVRRHSHRRRRRRASHGAEGVWVGTRMVASMKHSRIQTTSSAFSPRTVARPPSLAFGPEYSERAVAFHQDPPGQARCRKAGKTKFHTHSPAIRRLASRLSFRSRFSAIHHAAVQRHTTRYEHGRAAGEESVRKLEAIRPAAIVAEMMAEAREILERSWRPRQRRFTSACSFPFGCRMFANVRFANGLARGQSILIRRP